MTKLSGCVVACLFTISLLALPGAAQNTGGTTVAPVVNTNVHVIAVGASTNSLGGGGAPRIASISPNALALSGTMAALKPGDILVSSQGQGFLRKVVSSSSSGSITYVRTQQAKLTDVFRQANISLKRSLGASDFSSITPLHQGVIVRNANRSAGGPRANDIINTKPLTFQFVHFQLGNQSDTPTKGASAELNGSLTVQPAINVDIQIGGFPFPSVTEAHFIPQLTTTVDVDLTATAQYTIPTQTLPLVHLEGDPITIYVGPVPVVFTPEIEVSAVFSGSIGANGGANATSSLTIKAGVEFQNSSFSGVLDTDVPAPTFEPLSASAGMNVHLTPIHADCSVLLYGVAGPYLHFDVPEINAVVTATTTPDVEACITADADFSITAGFSASILGFDFGKNESVTKNNDIAIVDACYGGTNEQPLPTPQPTQAPPTVTSLTVSPTLPSIHSTDVEQFTVSAVDQFGNPISLDDGRITWTSSNTSVATVTAGGFGAVGGVNPGTTTITATDSGSGLSASTLLTVTPGYNIVTNTNDDGINSLRDAINYSNVFPGTTITFNIPTSDPGFSNGVFTITPQSQLPQIESSNTVIDGTTQTAFTGDTNPNGPEIDIGDGPTVDTGCSLTIQGVAMDWDEGTLLGTLNIPSGGTLNLPENSNEDFNYDRFIQGGTINNAGNVLMSGSYSFLSFIGTTDATGATVSSGAINNSGTWTMQGYCFLDDNSDYEENYEGTGNGSFNNTGTLVGNGGNYRSISCTFNNSGTVNANATAGALYLGGGAYSGNLTAVTGATIGLSTSASGDAVVFNSGTTINGAGVIDCSSIVTLTTSATVNGTLELDDGLTGNANSKLIVPGTVNWDGGTLTGVVNLVTSGNPQVAVLNWNGGFLEGTLNIPSGGTLNLPENSNEDFNYDRFIQGGTINNAGNVLMSGSYSFLSFIGTTDATGATVSSGAINNSGTWTMQGYCFLDDNSDYEENYEGTGNGSFNNTGTLVGNGGNYRSISCTFNNSGTVNANATAGALYLGGGAYSGNLTAVTGATIGLSTSASGDAVVFNSGTTINGAGVIDCSSIVTLTTSATVNGTLELDDGLTGNANSKLIVPGTVNWDGGTLTGVVNLVTSGNPQVAVLNWNGGFLEGTLNIPSGGTLNLPENSNEDFNYDRFIQGGTINNAGNVLMSGSYSFLSFIGTTDATGATVSSGAINNSGTWTMQGYCFLDDNSDYEENYEGTGNGSFNNTGTLVGNGGNYQSISCTFSNTGAVNVNSGTLSFDIEIQTSGSTTLDGGELAGEIQINGGALTGTGTIAGDVTNGGTVGTGNTVGTLNITGNYTQTAQGQLNVKLDGTTPGSQFDQFTVGGTAAVAGTLNISEAGGFTPPSNSSFPIVTSGTCSGQFGTIVGASLPGGLALTPQYDPADITLVAPQAAPRTYSVSGKVTLANGTTALGNVTMTLAPNPATGMGSTQIATSVTDGSYTFSGLVNSSTYTLAPSLTGYTFAPAAGSAVSFKLNGANVTENFVGTPIPAATFTVSGKVTLANGTTPLGNVTMTLAPNPAIGTGSTQTITSVADGSYSFSELADGATYALTPSLIGYTFTPAAGSAVSFEVNGANATENFVGTPIPPATFTVSGKVTLANGTTALGNVTMTLAPNPTTGTGSAQTTTSATDGSYTFSGLANGATYTLTPGLTGYTFAPTAASSNGFTINGANITESFIAAPVTSSTHTISGTITANNGASSLFGVNVFLTEPGGNVVNQTTGSTGGYSFPDLPDGTYTVTPELGVYSFTPTPPLTVILSGADAPNQNFSGSLGAPSTVTVSRFSGTVSPGRIRLTFSGQLSSGGTAVNYSLLLNGQTIPITAVNYSLLGNVVTLYATFPRTGGSVIARWDGLTDKHGKTISAGQVTVNVR